MDYIGFLKDTIRKLHGCASTHLETIPVKEEFQGQTVWEGEVEVFSLKHHPKAKKIYAWGYAEGDEQPEMKAVTVLAVPPITNPQRAVQAFIVSQHKEK